MLEQKKLSLLTKIALVVIVLLLGRYCAFQRCHKTINPSAQLNKV